jgi:hypothetical protein
LPPKARWKTGVAEQNWSELYRKKFPIDRNTNILTAGSCFAQHIARYLRARKFKVIDAEPAPPGMSDACAKRFGYNLYSARYGNIYTARQLLQLAKESFGKFKPANAVWEKNGRYYDALRPNVEPDGLPDQEEVAVQRLDHLLRTRRAFKSADLCIFTFGLTESWIHRESSTVYPTAPGTIAGEYDPEVFVFKNFTASEVYDDFTRFRRFMKKINPTLKFLVTVSPVPLVATASQGHVLPATIYSKSVLRAVAGQVADEFEDVDYFPSYEMIATPFYQSRSYEEDLRTVRPRAIDKVMSVFFDQHDSQDAPRDNATDQLPSPHRGKSSSKSRDDVVCEEILLEALAAR